MIGTAGKSAVRPLARALSETRQALLAMAPRLSGAPGEVLGRLIADTDAAHFHAENAESNQPGRPMLLAVLGGTGTGKSTLVNRLCDVPDYGSASLTATSFRRTFTSGPVAISAAAGAIPSGWLGLPHVQVESAALPARGRADQLLIAVHSSSLTSQVSLVDTPDLDGDTPDHHLQADRVFRWCEAVLFVTTPEKYQMTELLGYYRLAARYGVPALYVMNKVDDQAASDDWHRQLADSGLDAGVFVVSRDDAGFSVPPEINLPALRQTAASLKRPAKPARIAGVRARAADLAGRIADQVVAPMRSKRAAIERVKLRLEAMVRPEAGVDVHPMTRHLQRRLQQQSVLYLMGPARLVDRLRSVPSLVARLPRSTWDLITKGTTSAPEPTQVPEAPPNVPDFRSELMDGLRMVQSRFSDVLAESGLPAAETAWRLDPVIAGDIATSELEDLRRWLEERWNSKPRDTRVLEKLFKAIPGGKHLTKLSEAAPYLLAATCAATNTLFGPVDQVVIGGYLLTTWLSERMSNEVAAKTRETNRRIAQRFNDLCERQVEHAQAWLDGLAPLPEQLDALESATERLAADEQ
jgi:hypothetical protein